MNTVLETTPEDSVEQQVEEAVTLVPDTGPTLTDHERAARANALDEAKRAEETRALKAQEAKANEELRAQCAVEVEVQRKQKLEEDNRQEADVRR